MKPALSPMAVEMMVTPMPDQAAQDQRVADREHQKPEDVLPERVGAKHMIPADWQVLEIGRLQRRIDRGEERKHEASDREDQHEDQADDQAQIEQPKPPLGTGIRRGLGRHGLSVCCRSHLRRILGSSSG